MLTQRALTLLWCTTIVLSGFTAAKAKEHIPLSTWDRIFRYTAYQAAAYTASTKPAGCQTPPFGSSLVKSVNTNFTDTQATIFRDDASKEFIIGFPGSVSLIDYVYDVQVVLVPFAAPGIDLKNSCKGCLVHQGFLSTWNSISGTLVSILTSQLKIYKGYTVTITGHSLGAAIAGLGYASLKGSGLPVTQAFTFGQPRCGNQAFADRIDKLSGATDEPDNAGEFWRITHADDIVPRAFITATGYQHSRTEFWQKNNTLALDGHTSPELTYRCFGQEPQDCINSYVLDLSLYSVQAHGYYTNRWIVGNWSCDGTL